MILDSCAMRYSVILMEMTDGSPRGLMQHTHKGTNALIKGKTAVHRCASLPVPEKSPSGAA